MSRTSPRSFATDEARAYWKRLHAALGPDAEELQAVCHPGGSATLNRYHAAFQRRALERALRTFGSMAGCRVLEVGCGNGRWCRMLRNLGAEVTGIDLSIDAIERNRQRIPGVLFEQADIADYSAPDASFDAALTITVLQHLPYELHSTAAAQLARLVRVGGSLICLENTRDRAAHVFARTAADWSRTLETHGFVTRASHGYAFDVPLRIVRRFARREQALDGAAPSVDAVGGVVPDSGVRRVVYGLSSTTERCWELLLPDRFATHCALVLERV